MSEANELERLAEAEYKYGFVTDVDADQLPPGLSEDVVRVTLHRARKRVRAALEKTIGRTRT